GGSFVWHWIKMLEKFRQQSDTVPLDHPGRFIAVAMVLEPMLHRQSGHSDVNAGFVWVAIGIKAVHQTVLQNRVVEKNNVNVVMKSIFGGVGDAAQPCPFSAI